MDEVMSARRVLVGLWANPHQEKPMTTQANPTPLRVEFWGDKYGQLRDPFGVTWSLGGPNH